MLFGLLTEEPICPETSTLPTTVQVAWISPTKEKVRGNTVLDVIPVSALREFIQTNSNDELGLLQVSGIIKKDHIKKQYKITLFDVSSDWLTKANNKRSNGVKYQDDCGFTYNKNKDNIGLPLYNITWNNAARAGFCVMPIQRFLSGISNIN